MTRMTTGFRVEFDEANRISLMRVEGRLTDESLPYLHEASRKYSSATDARVSIVTCRPSVSLPCQANLSRISHIRNRRASTVALSSPRKDLHLVYAACSRS